MSFYINKDGNVQATTITPEVYKAASDANLSVSSYINRQYAKDADLSKGTPYQQIKTSLGLANWDKNFGLQAPTLADIFDGKTALQAAAIGQGNGTPFGTESRTLFPATIIDLMELALQKDRTTDPDIFDTMVAYDQSIGGDKFEQPLINYSSTNPDGPEKIRSQRIAQFAEPTAMVRFSTSDMFRKIPTTSIGIEISDQAMKSTPLDLIGLTMARFNAVERDTRVYEALADCIQGDADINLTGAISVVTSTTLDAAATGGVMTHKAWIKWLYRQRRSRRITHVMCDLDTYLKVEGRTGRPGSNNYDPTLARVDVQAIAMNSYLGSEVKFFIVDAAVDGGPVAANTLVGIDARYALAHVSNTVANYSATEAFVMRRSQAMRIDKGEIYYRLHDSAWDSLLIA